MEYMVLITSYPHIFCIMCVLPFCIKVHSSGEGFLTCSVQGGRAQQSLSCPCYILAVRLSDDLEMIVGIGVVTPDVRKAPMAS